jgi:hypothetical protein
MPCQGPCANDFFHLFTQITANRWRLCSFSSMRSTLLFGLLFLGALSGRMEADAALPETGVTFSTSDQALQALYDAAERKEAKNVIPFAPGMKILVEGAQYHNCWIETQPMGGEMYAPRNLPVALNNQVIFLMTQRGDGRFPGMVRRDKAANLSSAPDMDATGSLAPETNVDRYVDKYHLPCWFAALQGFCFPDPAWRMYFWMGRDKDYLQKLYHGLAAYDAYLWRTRDSNGDGVLETWCVTDTGEDNSTRLVTRYAPAMWPFDQPPGSPGTPDPQDPKAYAKFWNEQARLKMPPCTREQVLVPFDSMDLMGYSYDARHTLAKISRELDNGKEAEWRQKADEVRTNLIAKLWDPGRHACFDRDKNGNVLPEVVHNNLRAMYHGVFSQQMADEFVKYHLLNPAEFWTPLPLPSIAVDSPLFRNSSRNDWSGQPEGLTYQRAIRALENYGHYSLVTELGHKLIDAVQRGGNRFSQQFDPFTGAPTSPNQDGYGPTILATLEYISRMHGIHADLAAGRVWWSACDDKDFDYTERWGTQAWTLTSKNKEMTGSLNGRELFRCTAGVRVVTDLDGNGIAVVGITNARQVVTWQARPNRRELTVAPDQVIQLDPSKPTGLADSPP